MVRIQLFSLFYHVLRRFFLSYSPIKLPNLTIRKQGPQLRLRGFIFNHLSLTYTRLNRRVVAASNSRERRQCLTRWKGCRSNFRPRVLWFFMPTDFSLRCIQNSDSSVFNSYKLRTHTEVEDMSSWYDLFLPKLNVDGNVRCFDCSSELHLHVKFVKWYVVNLNVLQLEYWRGGYDLQRAPFVHHLRFRFTNSRFTILFTNPWTRSDYFFVSAGIFTRYFFFQKSVKKSKALKLVMARFTRKMIILLELLNIVLFIRGLPFMLENLIAMLLSPLRHPFINPLRGDIFDEVNTAGSSLCVSSLVFVNIKPFGFTKRRLKGRIKRKIRRRIYRLNRPDY